RFVKLYAKAARARRGWSGEEAQLFIKMVCRYDINARALEQFFKKLEKDMAEVSMERHGHAKQLVVFFGAAGIGTW
ncbi:hypothetical protein HaLaN_18238, partial [Haematococcus lacustris]